MTRSKFTQMATLWMVGALALAGCEDEDRSSKDAKESAPAESAIVVEPSPNLPPASEATIATESPASTADLESMQAAMARASAVGESHKNLNYFAGTWQAKIQFWVAPGVEASTSEASSIGTPVLDGRFIRTEHKGTFFGQPHQGFGLLGYDNLKQEYVSQWVDNFSTGIFLAYGSFDATTKTYEFKGQAEDPRNPENKMAVREVFRILDDNHYTFEWYEVRDGQEFRAMQIDYARNGSNSSN